MAKHIAKYINCEFSAKNYLQKLKYNMHKDWDGKYLGQRVQSLCRALGTEDWTVTTLNL